MGLKKKDRTRIKRAVARRVHAVRRDSEIELTSRQVADLIAHEFPELTDSTLYNYCKPTRVRRFTSSERDYDLIVVASDFHVPFHHKQAVENWLQFCEDAQPEYIVINGDFLDCLAISRFPKPPGMPLLQDEVDEGLAILSRLRRSCPGAIIYFLEGNHEQRLERMLVDNPGLYGLRQLNIKSLLDLQKLRILHRRYMDPLHIGALTVVHGDKVSKHAAYSAKATLIDGGFRNVLVGHTHRMGMYCHTGAMGRRRAAEIGGLYDVEQADYIKGTPNWQNGFAVCRQRGDWLAIELVEVCGDGAFCVGGQMYRAGQSDEEQAAE